MTEAPAKRRTRRVHEASSAIWSEWLILLSRLWEGGKGILPALPILAVLGYGLLRQLYAKFYGALGASPEDVGLGYSELLALSALGVVALFVIPAVLVVVATLVVPGLRHPGSRLVPWARALAATYLAMVFLGVSLLLWQTTSDAAGRAFSGGTVRSVNFFGVQILGLRAEPATLTWLRSPPPLADSSRCLLYLGQSDGLMVLFDPGPPSVQTIRVRTDDALLTVIRSSRAPDGALRDAACVDGRLEFP